MAENRLKSAALLMGVMALGIGLAVVLYFYQMFYKTDNFLPGVKIGSVAVQGLSREEAAVLLEKQVTSLNNTTVTFFNAGYTYDARMADLCKPVNIARAVDEIWEEERERSLESKIFNMDGSQAIIYPLKVEYNPAGLAKLSQEWNQVLGSEAVNARLEMDRSKGLVVLPSKSGKTVDKAATFEPLPRDYSKFKPMRIPIALKETIPAIRENDLQDMGELSSFTTWYNAGDVNRSNNLYLAASAINTTMIAPGQIFSFNKKVGQRVYETGYRDALIIVGGKFEPGLGGGVCQVSSTLYNACLLAGLNIVERYNHALTVAYVPLGRDATVAYGSQDFRFKNNTQRPVYISANARGGRLNISIYGNLQEKKKIQISTVVDQSIPFKEVREVDPTLKTGQEKVDHVGLPGYVVRSFRLFLDSNGVVDKKEQLATDHYKPLDKLILTGPGSAENLAEIPGQSSGNGKTEPEKPGDADSQPQESPQNAQGDEAPLEDQEAPNSSDGVAI
ncbi:MAG: VanW family protein [Syntrophomonas sp.]